MIKAYAYAFLVTTVAAGAYYYYKKFKREHAVLERSYRGIE
ncbi:hypothetical protein WBU96_28220 [Bacillus albus]